MMPITLAIETSQHRGGVALRDRAGAVHVEMLRPAKRHDDDLLPAIDRMFSRANVKPGDLASGDGGVGVSIGPGGFTGLRIAISVAKMFAETLKTKLAAVPSALVAAESLSLQSEAGSEADRQRAAHPHAMLVALASKHQTFWATRVERAATGHWEIVGQPGLADAESMDLAGVELMLADEHLPQEARRRCEQAGLPIVEPTFDPRACLFIAERMLAAGQTTDPLMLLPLYPRPPEAVSLWERKGRA